MAGNSMASPSFTNRHSILGCGAGVCHPFMVLGLMPNTMNRFVRSNTHEVLFVT
jgi:hypothetical protein